MKKKNVLWLSLLLLMSGMFCSCSNDEEDGITPIVGYWEYSGIKTGLGLSYGLYFQKDGKIKYWYFPNMNEYTETEWGLCWNENGVIQIKQGSKTVNPDELYYKIVTLTESHLVIRVFGGIAGTHYEDGYDIEYMKLSGKPKYILNYE